MLVLSGNGDPLARKDTRELLMNFPVEEYPGVRFEILTNGLLWTPAVWEKVKGNRLQHPERLDRRGDARDLREDPARGKVGDAGQVARAF